MTVNEINKDAILQGFTIYVTATPEKKGVSLVISKPDTDNLRFDYKFATKIELLDPENDEEYITLIKNSTAKTNKLITRRHEQDISSCFHKEIMIGNLRACEHCMAKFGSRMMIDLPNQ